MDGELVRDSTSSDTGQGEKPLSYSEIFENQFPYYLSIGMSPAEYWDGDPSLVKAYREAYKTKLKIQNQLLWLQGRYVYDAICQASPIYNAFAKKGTKPIPYTKEPYPLATNPREEKESAEKQAYEQNKAYMEAFAMTFNKKYKEERK